MPRKHSKRVTKRKTRKSPRRGKKGPARRKTRRCPSKTKSYCRNSLTGETYARKGKCRRGYRRTCFDDNMTEFSPGTGYESTLNRRESLAMAGYPVASRTSWMQPSVWSRPAMSESLVPGEEGEGLIFPGKLRLKTRTSHMLRPSTYRERVMSLPGRPVSSNVQCLGGVCSLK